MVREHRRRPLGSRRRRLHRVVQRRRHPPALERHRVVRDAQAQTRDVQQPVVVDVDEFCNLLLDFWFAERYRLCCQLERAAEDARCAEQAYDQDRTTRLFEASRRPFLRDELLAIKAGWPSMPAASGAGRGRPTAGARPCGRPSRVTPS